ncbi:MAG TPA: GNAT family N-acetyltransferase, partial [Gaiellaceae bacterium]
MIELRVSSTDADYESWASIKTRVIPDEPITGEQLRATDEDGRLLLLAALDGVDAGCGIGVPSGFVGLAFFGVRVLPEHRRRRVGTELTRALCDHARALGREGVNAFVDATDLGSFVFAEELGLREVDYQLHQARVVGDEPP